MEEPIVCVDSTLESDNTTKIRVYIQNTEERYKSEFIFYANSSLNGLICYKCEDGTKLALASDAAVKHMNELREINRSAFSKWLKNRIKKSLWYRLTHRKEKKQWSMS